MEAFAPALDYKIACVISSHCAHLHHSVIQGALVMSCDGRCIIP
jgi:hypothetical protein